MKWTEKYSIEIKTHSLRKHTHKHTLKRPKKIKIVIINSTTAAKSPAKKTKRNKIKSRI